MGAGREFDHDVTGRDIAFLLAEAVGGAEIGAAPTQAVIRGGRRRRARRWAVAAATALVVAASSGALAVTALPGGGGHRVAPAAQAPASRTPGVVEPGARHLLATGVDQGRTWQVDIDVWPAPRDVTEARALLTAMAAHGEYPADADEPSDLVGRSAYFVRHGIGEAEAAGTLTTEATTTRADRMTGTDIEVVAVPLDPAAQGPQRLVIGHVATTARQVTCTWKDGTMTGVPRATGSDVNTGEQVIRTVEGSPYAWFVCLAPHGTAFESARVTQ
ncbi:hypothetical protein I3F60_27250 [Streptomyces sp. MUM 136J]|uniref:hypothetical protein n=1 Tax=Streptomyces sp. MUM 136J TaxID=2791992 RepID=UPI001F03FBBD|nr:hypothetical protein [Streptomyces sp. MUM 136J]MCH0572896.1 hypothetical protein [Streptomyces sp. MUM 136J]